MSVASVRATLAATLDNPSVWSVYSFPPASPTANSVVISPDDPYIEPTNQRWDVSFSVNFKITLIVPLFDNQGNLNGIEEYMTALFNKLSASAIQFRIGSFSAPSVLPTDAGQMLATDVTITTLSTWS